MIYMKIHKKEPKEYIIPKIEVFFHMNCIWRVVFVLEKRNLRFKYIEEIALIHAIYAYHENIYFCG